jgi:hypothetical protein
MARFYPLPGIGQPGARKKISLFSCGRPGIGQVLRMSNTNQSFEAFKKTESGQYFIQWKKGGRFVLVEKELAEFVIFAVLSK